MQRIGAFKARGAFHAILHLIDSMGLDELRKRGVVTHSSGNHAQALALAAYTFQVPAYIVMPTISTPSKISGTQAYTDHVIFSGSTSQEREAVVEDVIKKTGAILVPPYDHPDIQLGQGTAAYEMDQQYRDPQTFPDRTYANGHANGHEKSLAMVMTPLGGGGLCSGSCIYFSESPKTRVFGAEPSYQGGDDAKRGFYATPQERITTVKTLTIADGLRTPLGVRPWDVFTGQGNDKKKRLLEGIYSVSEEQIKDALRLVMERMKVFVEPSAVVPLAALLYDEGLRKWIEKEQQEGEVWDVGIVLSGGNTTLEALVGIFSEHASEAKQERATATLGADGRRVAENVAG